MSALEQRSGEAAPDRGCPVAHAGEYNPYASNQSLYAFYARARRESAVFYSELLDAYVVTRYEDCVRILRDDANFSANAALAPNFKPIPEALKYLIDAGFVAGVGEGLADEDPPIHRAHRQAVQRPFSAANAMKLEPWLRKLVAARIDEVVKDGEAELVSALFYEVPAITILTLMGVPADEELDTIRLFGHHWAIFGWGQPTDEQQIHTCKGMAEFWSRSREYIHRLLEKPGDDIMSHAIRELTAQGNFDLNWMIRWAMNAPMVAHETTMGACAAGARALLENRGEWDKLCANPSLIPNAIDECLRFDTSVPTWRQRARNDVELGGIKIPAGATIYVALCSANRDSDVFGDKSEALDVERADASRHVAFGSGRHTCLGKHLGKLEMLVMFEELTRRLPHMELLEEFSWWPKHSQRRLKHLRVRWDPASNPRPEDRP